MSGFKERLEAALNMGIEDYTEDAEQRTVSFRFPCGRAMRAKWVPLVANILGTYDIGLAPDGTFFGGRGAEGEVAGTRWLIEQEKAGKPTTRTMFVSAREVVFPQASGERNLSIRRMLLPKDANPHGYIFGGAILAEIDLAGAIEAQRHTPHGVVTKYMNGIQFDLPVCVGDTVTLYTTLVKKGTTSLTVKVEIEASRNGEPAPVAVVATEVVYVAVERGPDGKLHRVPVDQ